MHSAHGRKSHGMDPSHPARYRAGRAFGRKEECAFTDGAGRSGPDALPSAKAGIASHKADPKAASMSRMTLHPTTEAVRITLSPGNARPS